MTQPPSGAQTSPQPRMSEDDRIARLQLLRSPRVGPATYRRLMAAHGTAAEALRALPDLARSKGVKSYQLCSEHMAQREYFTGKKIGADLIFEHEAGYPRLLAEISDAPPFLWVLGQQEQLTRPCVAVVGARNASSLGTRMAHRLAAGLAEAGLIVVSGLARGIDAAAHAASLPHGTIGVHAGGLDVIYPAENSELAKSILQKGARISEQPIGFHPTATFLPQTQSPYLRPLPGGCDCGGGGEIRHIYHRKASARARARGSGCAWPSHGCARRRVQCTDPRWRLFGAQCR